MPKSKTIDITIPIIRCVCIICGKKLHAGGKWEDLNICTTDGSVVLTCTEHAPKGDVIVQAVQLYSKQFRARSGNLHIPPEKWLKELFQFENCAECHRGARSHEAVPVNGNWFARCKPLKCGQTLHGERGFRARCTQQRFTEHDHSEYTAEQAVKLNLAEEIKP